jgi:hypothetical protein
MKLEHVSKSVKRFSNTDVRKNKKVRANFGLNSIETKFGRDKFALVTTKSQR